MFNTWVFSLCRVGTQGAYPEPNCTWERLHRGGAGPSGAHISFPAEGLLPWIGHQCWACGEDPQAAKHHVKKGMEKNVHMLNISFCWQRKWLNWGREKRVICSLCNVNSIWCFSERRCIRREIENERQRSSIFQSGFTVTHRILFIS